MGFTFYTLDEGCIILNFLNYKINIPKSGKHSQDKENNGEVRGGSELAIQVAAQIDATKDHNNHKDAHGTGVGHLYKRILCLFIHWRGANNMKKGSSQTKIPHLTQRVTSGALTSA